MHNRTIKCSVVQQLWFGKKIKHASIIRIFFFSYQTGENPKLFLTFCPYFFLGFSRPGILKIEFQAFPSSADTLEK